MAKGNLGQSDSGSVSDDSDASAIDAKRVGNFLAHAEDPRTISQIKRSRIDLAKRYVFLCPMSLSKHFEALPHQAKDSALLVFRCSRNWLFPDSSEVRKGRAEARVECGIEKMHCKRNQSSTSSLSKGSIGSALYRTELSKEFMQWVLTKEKEGCVFWYKPEKNLEKLSQFFEEKIDPVNELLYRPLLLDPHWWRVRFIHTTAKYIANPASVISIITGNDCSSGRKDIDLPALQELIYQSNPTLEPISKWPHAPSMRFLPRASSNARDFSAPGGKYKGYIDQDIMRHGASMPSMLKHHARISNWPETPRSRLDNLHHLWQAEDSGICRRQLFAHAGASALGPLSAR